MTNHPTKCMSNPDRVDRDPEEDMLPDERAVIADRAPELDELDDEEFLSTDEVASKLGFEQNK